MGTELTCVARRPLAEVLAAVNGLLAMVDGQLVPPTAPPPATWREVRVRTTAGMITLRRQGDQVALVVFGNADPALLAMRQKVADAFGQERDDR